MIKTKILSDEEIDNLFDDEPIGSNIDELVKDAFHRIRLVAQAQNDYTIRQFVEWGNQHCIEHPTRMNNVLHRTCNECWQSLQVK